MFFSSCEDKKDTERRDRAESHVGPRLGQGRCAVGQEAVQEIPVIALRPKERDRLGVGRPGILQETKNDRQEDKRRQQSPQQSVEDEGDPVQDHPPEAAETAQPHRPPDSIQHCHDDQHIEKVKITHRRHKHHEDEKTRLFFAEISLASDQDQRKKHKGVQEIMMAHSRHGKPVENIDQRAGKNANAGTLPHVEGISAEGNAGQPEAGHEHQIMKGQQIPLRYKDGGQAERIPDHIIGQGRKEILAVSHAQAESREPQDMRLPKLTDHFPSPARKIEQPVIMLIHPVRLPDETLFSQPEPHKNRCRNDSKQGRIAQKIDDIVPDPQGPFCCRPVFIYRLHFCLHFSFLHHTSGIPPDAVQSFPSHRRHPAGRCSIIKQKTIFCPKSL